MIEVCHKMQKNHTTEGSPTMDGAKILEEGKETLRTRDSRNQEVKKECEILTAG